MTATEFGFLAAGLVLGVAAGAALLMVLRARPPAPRAVRLIVERNAIPQRRSATLSDDAFVSMGPEPARGGPADRRLEDRALPDAVNDRRTTVRSDAAGDDAGRTAVPIEPAPGRTMEPVFRLTDPRGTAGTAAMVGISIDRGDDPMLAALHVGGSASASPVSAMRVAEANGTAHARDTRPMLVPTTVASVITSGGTANGSSNGTSRRAVGSIADRGTHRSPVAATDPSAGSTGDAAGLSDGPDASDASGGGASAGSIGDPSDACATERRVAAERCGFAVGARSRASDAAEALRAAQRTYDAHIRAADAAASTADPQAVRREKEAAQARFRAAYNGSKSTGDAEAAARDWLVEINDINNTARTEAVTAKRERAAAGAIGTGLEHLTLEVDAARIAAEAAEAACLVARQALAECDERVSAGSAEPQPQAPWSERPTGSIDEDEPLAAALSGGGAPTIFRLLRGDEAALTALVARLAASDPAATTRWRATLIELVDAIVAVSIEAGSLEFPADHPFWGSFTLVQDREIAQALGSLGHRFDGLGGFIDERIPTQRVLSMAMGYAGLDPMRIRQWPTEAEMAALFSDLTVAADEHLAATAGDLSLSDLIALLGRRADGLADLWNDWGRIRPLLLEGA